VDPLFWNVSFRDSIHDDPRADIRGDGNPCGWEHEERAMYAFKSAQCFIGAVTTLGFFAIRAGMTERNRRLPQSTNYLRAARAGIQMLEEQKPMDDRLLFLVLGILASLRAVQHSLLNHDRTLSPAHIAAVDDWKKRTPMDGKEISFIKNSRDLVLKAGAFPGGAGFRSAEFDADGTMRPVPRRWEAYYLVDGKHRDLIADMRTAADWCEAQLSKIEPHVPVINLAGDTVIDEVPFIPPD
jgi:hypothetical protein